MAVRFPCDSGHSPRPEDFPDGTCLKCRHTHHHRHIITIWLRCNGTNPTTNPVEKWIVIGLNFMLISSIVTIAIALISSGIQDLLKRQKSMLASLEKSEEKFRVLFEFAPDAYYLNDLQGALIDGNRTAEDLLGYKKKALIGKNFLELNLLSPDQLPKAAKLLRRNLEGKETGPDEFILNNKSGESIAVEIRTSPRK